MMARVQRRAGRSALLGIAMLLAAGTTAAVAVLATGLQDGDTYTNPVFEPILADPSVVRAPDGTFYAYGTEDDWGDGAGSRPIPVARSTDLVEWEHVGEAFERRPRWKSGYLWAPDIAAHGDGYLLYYSVSVWGDANPGIGVASAQHPEGPFTDHGQVLDSAEIGVPNSIDPHFHVDADGTPYLFWGSFHGIHAVELTDDGLAVAGEPVHIAGDAFEAPYVIERDGAFWFFGSLGSCCEYENSQYRVAVGRADSLLGPYVDRDGIDLRNGPGTLILAGGEEWAGPGHNAVVADDSGRDWIVYHAIDRDRPRADSGANRRVLMIDPLVWEDSWPTVAGGVPGSAEIPAPSLER